MPITAIPYYAWDNRSPGAMKVWLPRRPRTPAAGGLETQAKVSLSFVSGNCQPWGINDGLEPRDSNEQPAALCHWWPHRGGDEWVQYTWKTPVTLKGTKVYWFDDTGRGACRLPASWRIEYRDGAALEAGRRVLGVSHQEGRLVRGELRPGQDHPPCASRSGCRRTGRRGCTSGRSRRVRRTERIDV